MNSLYSDYSEFTATTARYPWILEKPYLALGLCDETCDEFNRAMALGDAPAMFLELGDAQWYVCRLSSAFGFEFADIVASAKIVYGEKTGAVNRVLDELVVFDELVKTAGAIAGRVKKYERDRDTWNGHTLSDFNENLRVLLIRFVSLSMKMVDIIWKLDRTLGNYDSLLAQNMAKLSGRLERGTLRGEGDVR